MVKFWDLALDDAINVTKYRIKNFEKKGIGDTVMREKAILKLQERTKQLRKDSI